MKQFTCSKSPRAVSPRWGPAEVELSTDAVQVHSRRRRRWRARPQHGDQHRATRRRRDLIDIYLHELVWLLAIDSRSMPQATRACDRAHTTRREDEAEYLTLSCPSWHKLAKYPANSALEPSPAIDIDIGVSFDWRGLDRVLDKLAARIASATASAGTEVVDLLAALHWQAPASYRLWPERLYEPPSSADQIANLWHLAAFVPLGYFAAVVTRLRASSLLGIAVCFGALLTLGKVLIAGRHPDMFDVLFHTAGAALGLYVARAVHRPVNGGIPKHE